MMPFAFSHTVDRFSHYQQLCHNVWEGDQL